MRDCATLINTGVLIGYRWHRAARIWRTPVLGEVFMAATTPLASKAVLRLQNPGLRGLALDSVTRAISGASSRAVLGLYRATPAAALAAPDTGHWPMHERPGDLRDIVLPFLREQTAR